MAAGAIIAAVVLAGADPAGAHAELSATTPADGQVLSSPPEEIELRFTESVGSSDDAVQLFDADGDLVLDAGAEHPDGDVVVLALDGVVDDLADGGYVVSWRVVSADAHPIQGAFVFHVGERTATTVEAAAVAGSGGSDVVGVTYGVVRAVVFAALLVLVGGAAFCAVLWPAGFGDRRARRILDTAVVTAAAATAAGLLLQGPYQQGRGLGAALDPSVVADVAASRFGLVWLGRLALLAAAAALLRRAPRRGALGPGLVVGAGLLASPGAAGHGSTGHLAGIALPVDVVHLGAASLWLGGLVLLATCVLARSEVADGTDRAAVASSFSPLALWCVVALGATGGFQAWRQVAELDQLTGTTFGRLLLVKLGLFAGLLALAGMSRAWVLRHRRHQGGPVLSTGPGAMATEKGAPESRVEPARLRRSVGAEALVAVALLGVTAQLVNAPPPRSASAAASPAGPVEAIVELDDLVAEVTVGPSRAGTNELEIVTRDRAGTLAHVQELAATLHLPERDIGPFDVAMEATRHARFEATAVEIPFPGDWELRIVVTVDDFDRAEGTTTIIVG